MTTGRSPLSSSPVDQDALEQLLRERYPTLRGVQRRAVMHQLSCLELELGDAPPVRLAFKTGKPGDCRVEKEILLYRQVLGAVSDLAPRHHASVLDEDRVWLLLEWLDEPWAPLPEDDAELTAHVSRTLARFHGAFEASAAQSVRRQTSLLGGFESKALWDMMSNGAGRRHSAQELRAQLAPLELQAEKILAERSLIRLPSDEPIRRILSVTDEVIDRLCALPPTLLHGDLHRWNARVRRDDGAPSVRLFDWGFAGIGPGQLDLGYVFADDPRQLSDGPVYPVLRFGDEAEVALRAYWEERHASGAEDARSWKDFTRTQRWVNLFHAASLAGFVLRRPELRSHAPILVQYAAELSCKVTQ